MEHLSIENNVERMSLVFSVVAGVADKEMLGNDYIN